MNKIAIISGILLICIVGLIFVGCDVFTSSDSTFQIKVSGTAGLKFSGSYMAITSDGKSTSKSVDGVVPAQYSVYGTIISAAFQKQVESGTLKVEILQGGIVVNSSDTTAAYGVVTVVTD